jgi:hypothetical protein
VAESSRLSVRPVKSTSPLTLSPLLLEHDDDEGGHFDMKAADREAILGARALGNFIHNASRDWTDWK